jgi:hypothetical protein
LRKKEKKVKKGQKPQVNKKERKMIAISKKKKVKGEGSKGEKEMVYNNMKRKTEASKSETINPDRFAKSEVSREFSVSCPRSEKLVGRGGSSYHYGPANPGIYPL